MCLHALARRCSSAALFFQAAKTWFCLSFSDNASVLQIFESYQQESFCNFLRARSPFNLLCPFSAQVAIHKLSAQFSQVFLRKLRVSLRMLSVQASLRKAASLGELSAHVALCKCSAQASPCNFLCSASCSVQVLGRVALDAGNSVPES